MPILLATTVLLAGLSTTLLATTLRLSVRAVPSSAQVMQRPARKLVGTAIIGVVLFPLVAPFMMYDLGPPRIGLSSVEALSLSVLASMVAGFCAISFAIGLRLVLPRQLAGFGRGALAIVAAILAIKALPGLTIMRMAYTGVWPFLQGGDVALIAAWVLSQVILQAPFLILFAIWIHQDIRVNELEFQHMCGATITEISRLCFVGRFWREYILVLMFAWSFVWTEGTVNRVVSDRIPSLSAMLSPLIGAHADYRSALGTAAITLVPLTGALMLWSTIAARRTGPR
jgi:hypothetical protein